MQPMKDMILAFTAQLVMFGLMLDFARYCSKIMQDEKRYNTGYKGDYKCKEK